MARDMCRLFALSADQPVTARFWLLDAPYSLRLQSRHNADGTGIGWIDEFGAALVAKRPVAAYASERFEHTATSLTARTMIAHIRLSSGTSADRANTHPFLMNGIVMAHNGVLHVTEELRDRVRELGTADLVQGTTDSEWMCALIAGEVARREADRGLRRVVVPADALEPALDGSGTGPGGESDASDRDATGADGSDVSSAEAPAAESPAADAVVRCAADASSERPTADTSFERSAADPAAVRDRNRALRDGLVAALTWIARHVPVYSANLLVARDHHLYALRLPATNELWVLDRPAGAVADEALDQASDTLRARSDDLRDVHSVVVASEPMDDDESWRLLEDGELLHVDPDGIVTSESPLPALAHPLGLEDLGLSAAASQAHAAQVRENAERKARREAA